MAVTWLVLRNQPIASRSSASGKVEEGIFTFYALLSRRNTAWTVLAAGV